MRNGSLPAEEASEASESANDAERLFRGPKAGVTNHSVVHPSSGCPGEPPGPSRWRCPPNAISPQPRGVGAGR